MKFFKKFVRDNKAATAIEYGLIAALISIAAISVMGNIGSGLRGTFGGVDSGLQNGLNKAG
jgi:pilus assembly protein Flp/PilA